MKLFAAAVLALAWGSLQAAAPPAKAPPPAPPPPDLRQALQQYLRGTTPAPRQLTEPERAELRRQLSDYAQPQPVRRR